MRNGLSELSALQIVNKLKTIQPRRVVCQSVLEIGSKDYHQASECISSGGESDADADQQSFVYEKYGGSNNFSLPRKILEPDNITQIFVKKPKIKLSNRKRAMLDRYEAFSPRPELLQSIDSANTLNRTMKTQRTAAG